MRKLKENKLIIELTTLSWHFGKFTQSRIILKYLVGDKKEHFSFVGTKNLPIWLDLHSSSMCDDNKNNLFHEKSFAFEWNEEWTISNQFIQNKKFSRENCLISFSFFTPFRQSILSNFRQHYTFIHVIFWSCAFFFFFFFNNFLY